MRHYQDDPVQAYMKGYHTYKNDKQEAEARRGADRMMEAYNKLKASNGGCRQNSTIANVTPFNCNGRKFVFPIATSHQVPIGKAHHDYSATDIFVMDGKRKVAGDPIVSITDGEVVAVNKSGSGDGGLTVRIADQDNTSYYYAHLQEGSNLHLKRGDKVKAGQQIGRLGDTGNAKGPGPHLHLGIAKREGPQHKGYFPSQKIDPRPGVTGTAGQSNYIPLNAWKAGKCADPRT